MPNILQHSGDSFANNLEINSLLLENLLRRIDGFFLEYSIARIYIEELWNDIDVNPRDYGQFSSHVFLQIKHW